MSLLLLLLACDSEPETPTPGQPGAFPGEQAPGGMGGPGGPGGGMGGPGGGPGGGMGGPGGGMGGPGMDPLSQKAEKDQAAVKAGEHAVVRGTFAGETCGGKAFVDALTPGTERPKTLYTRGDVTGTTFELAVPKGVDVMVMAVCDLDASGTFDPRADLIAPPVGVGTLDADKGDVTLTWQKPGPPPGMGGGMGGPGGGGMGGPGGGGMGGPGGGGMGGPGGAAPGGTAPGGAPGTTPPTPPAQ